MQIKLIIITLIFLVGFGCKKNDSNDCSKAVCPAVLVIRPFVKFIISDKVTNEDLFFGSSPRYQLKDLTFFKNKNSTDTVHLPLHIDSINNPIHFFVFNDENPETFFIQIQNQKADTIMYNLKPVITNCCFTGYIFESLNLNGSLICSNCNFSEIINVKK